jgi:GntR family transcriptional repressor for pyruvate dehydrogenase complex
MERTHIKQAPKSQAAQKAGPAKITPIGFRLKVPKAAELVSNRLRSQIVRGQLPEGSALAPERELIEKFGVSRPTLREAIRILESEGLVSIQRGARGGAIVQSPNVRMATRYVSLVLQTNGTTLIDIHRVHRLIEPTAARFVAEQFSRTAPSVLYESVEQCLSVFADNYAFGVATAAFRNKLIELTEIPTLSLLMSMTNDIFQRYWGAMTANAAERADNAPTKRLALRSFKKLIGFIEAGDGASAEQHWRKHNELVERNLRDWPPASQVIDLLDE